jgi:polysaccharide export outer membrane protein
MSWGDVVRPGAYLLDGNDTSRLTVLQMVAVAGETLNSAVPSKARLLRKRPDGTLEETSGAVLCNAKR